MYVQNYDLTYQFVCEVDSLGDALVFRNSNTHLHTFEGKTVVFLQFLQLAE